MCLKNRWIWTRKTLLPRQDGGETTIWSSKWLLEILQRGNLEQSRSAINTHYIANGERIYRIGMKMKNQELFYHV
mgnify:CR=1 FL=1